MITDFAGGADYGRSVAIQTDGKITVAGDGYGGSTVDFALARYNSNGSLDTTFDTDGKVTTDFAGGIDYGWSVAIQTGGQIVVAGQAYNGSNGDFALARYNSDGSVDTTFDTDGKVTTDFWGGADYGQSVAIQADGKIAAAGFTINGSTFDFALARFNGGSSVAYTENDGPRVVDAAITLTDADSPNMASATIQITGNYQNGQDTLSIAPGDLLGGVTANWNSTFGTLTLTGSTTKANYESMLSHVTYTNNSEDPNTAARTVTWTVNDGFVDSTSKTSTITVAEVNDAPVAVNDGVYEVAEDGWVTVEAESGVLVNDTDADSPTLHAVLVDPPLKGFVTLNDDGGFTYNPDGDFENLATGATEDVTFTYRANDGSLNSEVATVAIRVTGANDAPVANDDAIYTVSEDGPPLTGNVSQVLANDTDADSPPLTDAELVSLPSKGVLTVNELDGTVTYEPNHEFDYLAAGETENVTFTYRALDDQGAPSNVRDGDDHGDRCERRSGGSSPDWSHH